MTPDPHQLELAELGYDVLAKNMIVYLATEERTGKTLASILICERTIVNNVLVITKKAALPGWRETLEAFDHKKNYTVTNYHQATKFDGADYDLIILDEAHAYVSAFPKRSKMWKSIAKITEGKPLIYLSATPKAQGAQLLYNQFALSSWSPFRKWSTPYTWFRDFGIPETIYLSGRQVETYKKVREEEVMAYCKHLFITLTRKEIGFEHEPEDKVHYIELDQATKDVYNIITKERALFLNGRELICDTSMKLRTTLHMIEGGVAKIDGEHIVLGNREKIDYILEHWGDTDEMVIMYNYIAEKEKLERVFKKAQILQASTYAEGVDLSHKEHLIVYSQNFSTAKHSQRRARQANRKRSTPITVHFLLVKKAISDEVYQTVAVNKQNYIDKFFTGETL